MRISFGPFAFDPQSRLLWRDGTEIALPPRVLGVLEVLIDRAGQVVPRQDLLDRVWTDAFVTDTSLAEAVSFLRQALGDDTQAPRYIQTVHRRGYRFLLTPTFDPPRAAETPPREETPTTTGPAAAAPGPVSPLFELIPVTVALVCIVFAAAVLWRTVQPDPDGPPVARFEVRAAAGTAFDTHAQPLAFSADGRTLAWSGCVAESGRCALYVRPVDRLDPQLLEGTEGARAPVFSPDGRWIAFFAEGALKKIAVAGGAAVTLAGAPDPGGAAWGEAGIVFAASAASGLSIVDAQGGAARPLTRPRAERGELRHRDPSWLPNGSIVFTIASAPDPLAPGELAIVPPGNATIRILRARVTRASGAGHSYLLIAAGTDLQAATFDERAAILTGRTDAVAAPATDGVSAFALGGDGTLAIVRGPRPAAPAWADGADAAGLGRLHAIAIAPDSRRAAGLDGNGDIWIADVATGAMSRLTFGGPNLAPAWSADGGRVYFAARDGSGAWRVASRGIDDRSGAAAPLASAPPQSLPSSAAPGGSVAVTTYRDGRTGVAIVPPGGAPRALTDGPFDEAAAAFSPDGRWLALESTESGRTDIVVRAIADGRRVPVSADGGSHPRWSADGGAVYFDAGRRLMKAAFNAESASVGRPEPVLDRADARAIAVAPSGRVLIARQAAPETAVVVLQWLRELRQRLPLPVDSPR